MDLGFCFYWDRGCRPREGAYGLEGSFCTGKSKHKSGNLKYEKKRNRNSPSSQLLKSTKAVREKDRGGGSLVLYLAVWFLLRTNAEDKSTSNDSFSLEGGGTKGGQGPSISGLGLTAARCPALHRNVPSWGAHSQCLSGV